MFVDFPRLCLYVGANGYIIVHSLYTDLLIDLRYIIIESEARTLLEN